MKIAVVGPHQIHLANSKKVITTNVTFLLLLEKARPFFDNMLLICREDRTDKKPKLHQISDEMFDVSAFKAGKNSKYISLLIDAPIIFIKIFVILFSNRRKLDVIWLSDMRIVGILSYMISRFLGLKAFFYIRGDNVKEANSRLKSEHKSITFVKRIGIKIEFSITKILVNRTMTFVCGDELYKIYKKPKNEVYTFISSLIDEEDILTRPKRVNNSGNISLLFVGRITKYKGLKTLLDALLYLTKNKANKKRNIYLSIVGGGPDENRIRDIVKKYNLSKIVSFRGYISDRKSILAIYDDCDIFIIPSVTEGTPKTIPEAMAKGLPIIATNVGAMPYMVKNGETGLIVEPGDSRQLQNAVQWLIDNPSDYERMSANSLNNVKEFTAGNQFKKMIKKISAKL